VQAAVIFALMMLSVMSAACQDLGLPEAFSTNLDRKNLVPLLRELASLIQTGFGEAEVKAFEKLVDSTKVKGTVAAAYAITLRKPARLRIEATLSDVDAVDIWILSSREVAAEIRAKLKEFLDKK
jgi:hypothetical protein